MDKAEPIHDRHKDIGNDQRGVFMLNNLQRFLTVACSDHAITLEFERCIEEFKDIGHIIYDKYVALLDIHDFILALSSEF